MLASMLIRIKHLAGAALVASAFFAASAAAQDAATSKVVVELYTSQGCNTCPPADAFLGELTKRADVIALSLHVDYWDYLGWKDRFASPQFSKRQFSYAAALGARRAYTPQIVVQGVVGMVGSHRDAVKMAIEQQAAEKALATLKLTRDGDGLIIAIAPTGEGAKTRFIAPLKIVAVGFDRPHQLKIGAGENDGATLTYHHVARDFRLIGEWSGDEATLRIAINPKLKGYAVFVQMPGPRRIVGAEQILF